MCKCLKNIKFYTNLLLYHTWENGLTVHHCPYMMNIFQITDSKIDVWMYTQM